jgi:sensor histidine kinase YesM
MKSRIGSAKYKWGFTLVVTNLAVLIVLFVLVAAGQIRTEGDFLHGLAYSLVFSNITSALAMLTLGTAMEKLARRRLPLIPLSLVGMAIVIPAGCLAAQAVLVAVHFVPAGHFWSQYLHVLKVATPLALVFGLGALAYASLRARLEVAELQLREKEIAEERARKLAAEARLRSLESWIHPHFLFNTLNSISALIPLDPARADQIVGRLATLLRASLDNSNHPLIPLRQELALVESYLDIERVRLGSKLRAAIDVPASFAETPVPPMSVQSLVENAVKYGIVPQPTGGEVLVTARRGGDAAANTVHIGICDSGPGFDLASVPPDHGLDKLVQRLDVLFGEKAALHVFRRDGRSEVEMVVPRT